MTCRNLEEALQHPEGVTRLELVGQGIQSLTAIPWARFRQLRYLNLDKNEIRTLSKRLLGLKQLRTLHLSQNQLRILPAWLRELSSLRQLHVNNNRLNRIDGLPPQLEAFFATNNKLNHWPEALNDCRSLLNLQLDSNPLQIIHNELANFPALRELKLALCRLQKIQLLPPKLFSLDIRYNRLQSLPDNWDQLTGLYRISLSHNRELSLPLDQLTGFPKLSVLRIKNCHYDFTLEELLAAIPQLQEWDMAQRGTEPAEDFFQRVIIPPAESAPLWWKLSNGSTPDRVDALKLQQIFTQTQYIRIRLSAQRGLLKRFRGSVQDLRKEKWSIQGKTVTPIEQLTERLKNQGVQVTKDITQHRILGYQWDEADCSNAQHFLDERTIVRWLDQQEQKPWSRSVAAADVQHMGQLLSSLPVHIGFPHPGWKSQGKRVNIVPPDAWLQWLQSSGIPDDLLPDLLEKTIHFPSYCEQLTIFFPYLPSSIQLLFDPLLDGMPLSEFSLAIRPSSPSRHKYLPPARFLGQGLAGKLLRQMRSWKGAVHPNFRQQR